MVLKQTQYVLLILILLIESLPGSTPQDHLECSEELQKASVIPRSRSSKDWYHSVAHISQNAP